MNEEQRIAKARAKHLRAMQQAHVIGVVETAVYKPFKTAWAWFNRHQTLKLYTVAIIVLAAVAWLFTLEDPYSY